MPPKASGSSNKVKDDKVTKTAIMNETINPKKYSIIDLRIEKCPYFHYSCITIPFIYKGCPWFFLDKVKLTETLTFWQKNKSAKVKAQVAQIQNQAAMAGKSRDALEKEKEKALRAKAKLEEEKRAKEEAALLKPVQTQKVPFGVDPKTILCAFYKAGNCEKGTKCKFSHDLNVGRKVEKKNLYEDSREEKLQGGFYFLFNFWF